MLSRHACTFHALLYALMDPTKEACRNRRLPGQTAQQDMLCMRVHFAQVPWGTSYFSPQAPCREHCQRWQLLSGGGLEAQMPARGRRNAAQQHTLAGGALCGGPAVREARVAAV